LTESVRHAFTVDVEDWYHGIPIGEGARRGAERRLHIGVDRLLRLLETGGHRATFFFLGPVAEEHGDLVRQIHRQGHEIGCHGWSHDLVYSMTPERFREETQRAAGVLAAIIGEPITAYRAAYFSITRRSLWAFEVLASLGFRYDSSVFPVRNWRYGIPDFDPRPQRLDTAAGPLYELPISVRRVFGRNIPVSGGAYFRLYPYALSAANIRHAEAAGRPIVFYLHPWELDPSHPRVDFDWRARLTHYVNLDRTEPRLQRLLRDFRFGTLGDVLQHEVIRTGS
jgi:polysaccharide deacetylase family protein (PEP-CTERM system associated)